VRTGARIGSILFIIGAIAVLMTLGIWLFTGEALPTAVYVTAGLMPLGLGAILISFTRQARTTLKK
jgi:hypothetical protein